MYIYVRAYILRISFNIALRKAPEVVREKEKKKEADSRRRTRVRENGPGYNFKSFLPEFPGSSATAANTSETDFLRRQENPHRSRPIRVSHYPAGHFAIGSDFLGAADSTVKFAFSISDPATHSEERDEFSGITRPEFQPCTKPRRLYSTRWYFFLRSFFFPLLRETPARLAEATG